MNVAYKIQSACECQVLLEADLDEHRLVISGTATRGKDVESAPANSVGASAARFDVVWHCPFCGRNTLRTFYAGALQRLPSRPAEAPAEA